MAAGLATGTTIPQFGALSAARWSALLHGRAELTPAFALETFSNEAAFLLGSRAPVRTDERGKPAGGSGLRATPPAHPARGPAALILTFLACASLLPLLANSPWQLGLALLLPGAGVAPCIIVSSTLIESVMDRSVLTQAFTWTNSASAAGIAVSAAAVGRLVDGPGGPRASFIIPSSP